MRWILLAAAGLLGCGLLNGPFGNPAGTFRPGDYVLVRGTLLDCPAWTNRPVALTEVRPDGHVRLFDLQEIPARGRSVEELSEALLEAFTDAHAGRPAPRLRVFRIARGRLSEELAEESVVSLLGLWLGKCPAELPLAETWTREEVDRLVAAAAGAGSDWAEAWPPTTPRRPCRSSA